MTHYMYLEDKM